MNPLQAAAELAQIKDEADGVWGGHWGRSPFDHANGGALSVAIDALLATNNGQAVVLVYERWKTTYDQQMSLIFSIVSEHYSAAQKRHDDD